MNLLAAKGGGRKRATGDTNEMVQARRRFLDKEHYADAAETVAETVARHLASRARERKNGEDRERNASEEEKDVRPAREAARKLDGSSPETDTTNGKKKSARAQRIAANKRRDARASRSARRFGRARLRRSR